MIESLISSRPVSSALVDIRPIEADGAITATDLGKLGLNLTRVSGSQSKVTTTPEFGKCLYFDGANAGFLSPYTTFNNAKPLTVSLDIRMIAVREMMIMTHVTWNSGGSSFGIYMLSDGRIQLYFNGGQRVWSSALVANTNYTIKVTIVGSTISLYVNGVLQGSYTAASYTENNWPIGLGSTWESMFRPFYGYMKNLLIENK